MGGTKKGHLMLWNGFSGAVVSKLRTEGWKQYARQCVGGCGRDESVLTGCRRTQLSSGTDSWPALSKHCGGRESKQESRYFVPREHLYLGQLPS